MLTVHRTDGRRICWRVTRVGTSSSESKLDATIDEAHAMGVELLFFDGMLQNQGDYTVDLSNWPSGLEAAGKRIKDAGLQVGLHMISTGAQTCHGNPNPNDPSCAKVTVDRPDVFVPQVSSGVAHVPS